MNLLLIFSALLAAIGGFGPSGRAPIAVQAVAGQAGAAAQEPLAERPAAVHPAAALPTRRVVAWGAKPLETVVAGPAIWASRRRE